VVKLVVTGGSLTPIPKRSLRCLLGRGTLTNKRVPKPNLNGQKLGFNTKIKV